MIDNKARYVQVGTKGSRLGGTFARPPALRSQTNSLCPPEMTGGKPSPGGIPPLGRDDAPEGPVLDKFDLIVGRDGAPKGAVLDKFDLIDRTNG
jgi:hypothetical protein